MQNIDWNQIRLLNHSQKNSFEELVCQLAKSDKFENAVSFVRKGSPDAGIECFWILSNSKEIGYQAKFFTSPLSSTQWGELDKSVQTALEKHSNLCTYIVSIPQDRADARIEGKNSFLEKWNMAVQKWKNWASIKGLDVDFIYEGSSELLVKLSKPENVGKASFWFNKDEFSNEWFKSNNKRKVKDLGARYNNKLNVLSEAVRIFKPIIFPSKLKKKLFVEYEKLELDFKSYFDFSKRYPEIHLKFTALVDSLVDKKKSMYSFNISDVKQAELLSHKILMQLDELIKKLCDRSIADDLKINRIDSENTRKLKSKHKVTSSYINKFLTILDSFDNKLAINPFLLIEGEAGIGKSHLFADLVTTIYNNIPSVLLLGQQFYTENLWLQISNQLQTTCSQKEFFGVLNSIGESLNCRVPILIDAINEGSKHIWKEQLSGFVNDIRSYPNLALIISVRSTYTEYVLSKSNLKDFERYTVEGFKNLPSVTKTFFKFYKINDLPVPILNPEFKNPLFLKLFCIGLKDNNLDTLPDDYDNITVIYNYYYKTVNKSLAERLRYDHKNLHLVFDAISLLADEMVRCKSTQIDRKVANKILIDSYRYFLPDAGMILSELINENILNENLIGNKEVIYFSYEKLGDYIIAKSLLNLDSPKIQFLAENGVNFIDESFNLFKIIENDQSIQANLGIIEALSILLPELYGIELFQLRKSSEAFIRPLITSLLWRNSSTIKEVTINYINKCKDLDKTVASEFINLLIQLSIKTNHRLNIYFVDSLLANKILKEIDLMWTIHVNDSEAAKILVNWASEVASFFEINLETKMIFSVSLSWLLSSSNREVRDKSTKALARLLQEDYAILFTLIKKFILVDDIYILERLIAVLYGITLRIKENENLLQIIHFVNNLKSSKEFQRHLLIENYIQGIISFANTKGIVDTSDYILPNTTICKDQFEDNLDSKLFFKRDFNSECHNALVSYITGEHSFIHKFLGTKENFKISNFLTSNFEAISDVVNNSNNIEVIDEIISLLKLKSNDDFSSILNANVDDDIENLYNKLTDYHILNSHDVLNIKSFFNKVSGIADPHSSFKIDTLQYYIADDVFNKIGWNENDFKEHDYSLLNSNFYKKNLFNDKESIGEKYIFISFYKWLSIISANYLIAGINPSRFKYHKYIDACDFLQVDIDPTIFFIKSIEQKKSSNESKDTFPLNLSRFSDQWICMGSFRPDICQNGEFQFVRKCLIIEASDTCDYLNYLRNDTLITHDFFYLNSSVKNCYLGEVFWKIESNLTNEKINKKGYLAVTNYTWSSSNDFSLNNDLKILVPSFQLSLVLEICAFVDGKFYDANNRIVAVATCYGKKKSTLFINKLLFVEKLKKRGLNAIIVNGYSTNRSIEKNRNEILPLLYNN